MPRERLIIPIFIPHQGCPYRCAFCDQKNISGVSNKADKEMIESTLNQYLGEVDSGSLPLKREVAFYGGSFTGLPMERQRSLFSIVQPWLEDGTIQ